MNATSALALSAALASACTGPELQTPVPPPPLVPLPILVSLAPNGSTIGVGDSIQVRVTFVNIMVRAWSWSVSDAFRATVSQQGWVLGVQPGPVAVIACVVELPSVCGNVTVFVR